MRITNIFLTSLLLSAFYSCNQAPAKEADKTSIAPPLKTAIIPIPIEQTEPVPIPSKLSAEDSSLTLSFQELTININRFIVFEDDENAYKGIIEKDTVEIYADLAETIEGQTITVTSEALTDITLEQRYETSVTIMDEGPHCDLTEWKHYTSEWANLPAKGTGVFKGKQYTEKDWERFPEVSVAELKAVVQKECGDDWLKHIRKVKSVKVHPSGVGISRFFLRVPGKRKDTSAVVQKVLVIEVPMGC